MRKISRLALTLVFITIGCQAQDNTKKVQLCQGKVGLEIPSRWRYYNDYLKFSNYEIKSDEMLFDAVDSSMAKANVFDSMYRKKAVVDWERLKFEREQDSLIYKKIEFLETGIKQIGSTSVGYLKCKLTFKKPQGAYMIQFFFKDSQNFYYEIQISNFKRTFTYFKPIADKIFNSLSLTLN